MSATTTPGPMRNVRLRPFRHASAFRRIAAVAWDPPREPNIYGTVFARAERLEAWLDAQNAGGAEPRLTVTHAVARAVALTLRRHPDANAIVRRGRLYLREDVDVFVHVAVPDEGGDLGGTDLSGVVVRRADQRSTREIARAVAQGAARIRQGEDADFRRTKAEARLLPPFLMRRALRLVDFLQFGLNVDTSLLGAPRDPFGSAFVSSLGMMGLRLGYAPFFPLARTPVCLVVGAVEDAVVAEGGAPRVVRQLTINATCDHRVLDGYHVAVLAEALRALLEEPERLDEEAGAER